jgi:hypothetical protein
MMGEQTRDIDLIGKHYWPGDQIELFKLIAEKNNHDTVGAAAYGYILGVMHGKRAERARKKGD